MAISAIPSDQPSICSLAFSLLSSAIMQLQHTLLGVLYILYYTIHYTVLEIVSNNRIIKILFWYYWRGGEDNQMFNIHEYENVWFLRFPYFIMEICIEAVNLHYSLWETYDWPLNVLSRLHFSFFSQRQIHCKSLQKLT